MTLDPVVAEIRRIRDEHAARFNYDIRAIVADLQKSEALRDPARSPLLPESVTPLEPAVSSVRRVRFLHR